MSPIKTLTLDDEHEEEDRLNNLPDEVLRRILDFLPTKYAVQTSVLSSCWRFLYSSLSTVDLDNTTLLFHPRPPPNHRQAGNNSSDGNNSSELVNFPEKPLESNTTLPIKHCRHFNYSRTEYYALFHHVRIISIDKCKTLQVLKLRKMCLPAVPESVTLPTLKVLCIEETINRASDVLDTYFSSCPVLEVFRMINCTWWEEVIEVRHDNLNTLSVSNNKREFQLLLDTPKLQHLEYHGVFTYSQVFAVKNIESLVSAGIYFNEESLLDFRAAGLINTMHNVRSLHLSCFTTSALYSWICPLATFPNLTFMELDTLEDRGTLFFSALLECCPNLEVLVFYHGFEDGFVYSVNKYSLCLPGNRPVCLSRSLREVRVGALWGSECETKVIRYLLMNGEALRKVRIGPTTLHRSSPFEFSRRDLVFRNGFSRKHWKSKFGTARECVPRACKMLAAIPRCSQACEIMLTWMDDGKLCTKIIS